MFYNNRKNVLILKFELFSDKKLDLVFTFGILKLKTPSAIQNNQEKQTKKSNKVVH